MKNKKYKSAGNYVQPTKSQIIKLCSALRSGKYKQTTEVLQDNDGYCCLGVACKIFIPKNKQQYIINKFISGVFPDDQPNSPVWLQDLNYGFLERSNITLLSNLNDAYMLSFDEIADLLETVYLYDLDFIN